MTRIRHRVTFANVTSMLALTVAMSTGGAYAAGYLVSSNSQVGPDTISGHRAPAGDHANLIAGSVTTGDLAGGAVGPAQLAANAIQPEAWHIVAANPQQASEPCSAGRTAVFCGSVYDLGRDGRSYWWSNAGGTFAPAAFYKDRAGGVHLRGLVALQHGIGGTYVQQIFTLPPGYRPAHELVFTALDNDTQRSYLARVDVTAAGSVQMVHNNLPAAPADGAANYLSLDAIAFGAGE